jgi:iron complex outermembrane receptor protein/vitamin B12 transporter
VEGVPGPWDFEAVSQNNRQADQDLYSGVTLENRYKDNWHNLVRYGIARKREQEQEFSSPALGQVVTVRGANGYVTTGQNQLYTGNNYDQASNRDQVYYQSDYSYSKHLVGLFGFRYDNERGVFNDYDPAFAYVSHQRVQRTNFEYNLQFQGSLWDRLFYSAGGAVEKNHLYGIAGTPRLGLSYVPVRPGRRAFHGTRLRANAATGVQEPTLALEESGLYEQATPAQRAQYHLAPPGAERSRTYDFGIDQNIWSTTLVLKAGYFHNVFDHQLEGVNGTTLAGPPFNINVPQVYEAYINSLAFRAQGAEVELDWQPKPHVLVRGGWTNLSTRVVQSFTSDALGPSTNPKFANIAIGNLSPLVGARPFRRPPNSGFISAQFSRAKFAVLLKAALASRSDDSTYLGGNDVNFGNSLLLPNHDLDFGYVKLDVGGTYALPHHLTLFTQLENLTNDQHIGPIGYPGLPLTVRAGLKLKLFGD